jgi:hypothetical protein
MLRPCRGGRIARGTAARAIILLYDLNVGRTTTNG